jgi:hypothetical protein
MYGWTARLSANYGRAMVRRTQFDPLDNPKREPRWLVVRNMHRAILEVRPLSPETDLRRTFILALLEWTDAGWTLGEFSSISGHFFCTRGAERRMVAITPSDPKG